MPAITKFRCSKCGFSLRTGWGGYQYVTDDDGKRIICEHPIEKLIIADTLGITDSDIISPKSEEMLKLLNERTGFVSDCVCLDCLKKFETDVERDGRICSVCNSNNIKTVSELIEQPCPRCHQGVIEVIDTGMIS